MENLTVIYYTANTEEPEFERRIISNLLKQKGGNPIITVSRKPMKLGLNICVGEQPVCYSNEWKQLLLGLKAAKTRFCIAAESDCLYPPEYFEFLPPREDVVYRYDNIWVYWKNRNKFWKKSSDCEGAQICGRDYWIERLELMLEGHEGWEPMERPEKLVRKIFPNKEYWSGSPVITFKTGNSLSYKTGISKTTSVSLPYWGDANTIKERMFT